MRKQAPSCRRFSIIVGADPIGALAAGQSVSSDRVSVLLYTALVPELKSEKQ
jgi:hypothetical protein